MKKNNIFYGMLIAAMLLNSVSMPVFGQSPEDECGSKTLTLIVRNSEGNFVPGISFFLHQQVYDVDGLPKPGNRVGNASISPILGKGSVSFRDDGGYDYALRINDSKLKNADYYIYNSVRLDCSDSDEITVNISALKISLWTADQELIKNQKFSLYTQKYDALHQPIREKKDLVGNFDTGATGEVMIYVPAGSDAIDGNGIGHYVLEFNGPDGGVFTVFDIYINSGSTNYLEYVVSDVKLVFYDEQGSRFPGNTKVELFRQLNDDRDQNSLGTKVKDLYTNDKGEILFVYPAGEYVARIMGADNKYIDFWDIEIFDGAREEYELIAGEEWRPGSGQCEASSNFILVLRDLRGNYLSGLNYALFEQSIDADGLPFAGGSVLTGKVDQDGRALHKFNPDTRKNYVLKIWDSNAQAGDFWYFNEFKPVCGQEISLVKQLPTLTIIMRDGDGNLIKNRQFSLYSQRTDADGRPIKEKSDLVGSKFTTAETGEMLTYLAFDHPYNRSKKGVYVLEVKGEFGFFTEYDIVILPDADKKIEYRFSDIKAVVKNGYGQVLPGFKLDAHAQSYDLQGGRVLGTRVQSIVTDNSGSFRLEYPAGRLAFSAKDDLGNNNIFWNNIVNPQKRSNREFILNTTLVQGFEANGQALGSRDRVDVHYLRQEHDGSFSKGDRAKNFRFGDDGQLRLHLAPGPYLFTVNKNKTDFGMVHYAKNGDLQTVRVELSENQIIRAGQRFHLDIPSFSGAGGLSERLKGHILLQVEQRGEAWYVHPEEEARYYLKDGTVAYEMMRRFGLGITTADLKKIPVGVNCDFELPDYDGDCVPDKMEEALGTDPYKADTDGDGFSDGVELMHGYDPLGPGKMTFDQALAERLKGRILLQVESRGEAWYLNPADGRRYYMPDGNSAYEIMRFLSLGITDANLEQIQLSEL